MNIEIIKNQDQCTIVVSGRIDANSAPSLDSVITNDINEIKNLVFDLNGLEYISSAGLRVFLNAQKKMNKLGCMKLVGVCEEVMSIFEMTGFADILNIE